MFAVIDLMFEIQRMIKTFLVLFRLNTNVEIHRALREALTRGDKMPTTPMDDHVARLFMFDFEQSGIHLEEEKVGSRKRQFIQE